MSTLKWWQTAVFYQIYPRSFADGNGDGIGDFAGMIEHLDYVRDLGIDALWLSPHYPSPFVDCGYDISDYTAVAPEYGSLDDFKRFLEEAHRRGIRVILDLVLNHTSDQHPWFVESRSGRDHPKRDWYVWRDGRDGGPPNNWYSGFGGSAWELDPATVQYYYHFFLKEQPDLNWRNPEVKQAMFDAARFWLDLGVDGFRLDAIGTIYEDPALTNHDAELTQVELYRRFNTATTGEERADLARQRESMMRHQVDLPGIHDLMQELRAVVDEYPDRVLVGETDEISYYGSGDNELHLVFNFPLMRVERLTPGSVRANQQERLAMLPPGAWPCNTLGNHDSPRVRSRFGDGQHDDALARISLALMLTLWGTPFLYNGEEIGMTDYPPSELSEFQDTLGRLSYRMAVEEMDMAPDEALKLAANFSRDKCRTPTQWNGAPNAGFSPPDVQTWLPVNPNYAQGVNVADQWHARTSLLSFYRQMLHMRKESRALIAGAYTPLHVMAEDYLAFLRTDQAAGQSCLVVLNMSDRAQSLSFDLDAKVLRLLYSSDTRDTTADTPGQLSLAPFEIYIAELL